MVFLLVPGVFIFQLTVIHPNLLVMLKAGIVKQIIHYSFLLFCAMNVIGNMILTMVKDSRLKKPVFGEGTYCEICRMMRPARSWHCKKCNVCIIKRDHHCTFLARCIGLHNMRYYILFLGHVMLSGLYLSCCNYFYTTLRYDNDEWIHAVACIINPMLRFVMPKPMGSIDMYVLYWFFNMLVVFLSGCLFFFHLRNVIVDVTSYESRCPSLMDPTNWRENLLSVFGNKWYFSIFCPVSYNPFQKENTSEGILKNL